MSRLPKLEDVVREKLAQFHLPALEPFYSELKNSVGDRACAILAYGSCLSEVTKSSTSTPDFYVVVASYRAFHPSWIHAVLNWVLPPSIYHYSVRGETAKYNVISLADLERETRGTKYDCYNLGRWSKRDALLFFSTPEIATRMVNAQASAVRAIARWALLRMPLTFSLETFAKECLRISYLADVRVEADDKIDRLYQAEIEYYNTIYTIVLHEFSEIEHGIKPALTGWTTEGAYSNLASKLRLSLFINVSRIRAQLRWPKGIVTVPNWIDYILKKISRTKGVDIQMTEKEKRFWFIYGWKHFYQMRKRKYLK